MIVVESVRRFTLKAGAHRLAAHKNHIFGGADKRRVVITRYRFRSFLFLVSRVREIKWGFFFLSIFLIDETNLRRHLSCVTLIEPIFFSLYSHNKVAHVRKITAMFVQLQPILSSRQHPRFIDDSVMKSCVLSHPRWAIKVENNGRGLSRAFL